MAASEQVKIGLDGVLFVCKTDPEADESTTGATWIELGYVNDFKISKKRNKYIYYKRYTRQAPKKGRVEITGSLGHLYTNYADSVAALAEAGDLVAFKLEVGDNGETATEVVYVHNVDLDEEELNFGNLNENGEMSCTANFTCSDYKVVEPT